MTILRSWRCLGAVGVGAMLAALTGCQTWVAGMTLPSGHYLEHGPQYIPPSPNFPLTNELADQEATYAARPGLPGIPAPVQQPGAALPPAGPVPAPGAAPGGPGQLPPPAPAPVP